MELTVLPPKLSATPSLLQLDMKLRSGVSAAPVDAPTTLSSLLTVSVKQAMAMDMPVHLSETLSRYTWGSEYRAETNTAELEELWWEAVSRHPTVKAISSFAAKKLSEHVKNYINQLYDVTDTGQARNWLLTLGVDDTRVIRFPYQICPPRRIKSLVF